MGLLIALSNTDDKIVIHMYGILRHGTVLPREILTFGELGYVDRTAKAMVCRMGASGKVFLSSTYLSEVPLWKLIFSQPYIGCINMKIYSPTNFPNS